MKRPIESPSEVRLRDLARQLDQLGIREVLPKRTKQLIAHQGWRAGHSNGKIENKFLDRTEDIAFFIVGEISEFLVGNARCPAFRRA